MKLLKSVIGMGMLLLAVGCSETRSYHVKVENHTSGAVTVWLTKESGPVEDGWMSPEQLAMSNIMEDDKLPAKVIPSGKTLVSPGEVTGEFDPTHGRAIMRVYSGQPTLSETLAIGRTSVSRLDLVLEQGENHFIIDDKTGIIHAQRVAPTYQEPK